MQKKKIKYIYAKDWLVYMSTISGIHRRPKVFRIARKLQQRVLVLQTAYLISTEYTCSPQRASWSSSGLVYLFEVLKRCWNCWLQCILFTNVREELSGYSEPLCIAAASETLWNIDELSAEPPHKSIQVIKFSQQHCITLHQKGRTEKT